MKQDVKVLLREYWIVGQARNDIKVLFVIGRLLCQVGRLAGVAGFSGGQGYFQAEFTVFPVAQRFISGSATMEEVIQDDII